MTYALLMVSVYIFILSASTSSAATYTIPRQVIASGGGRGTSATYVVNFTVGQPAVGTGSSASYPRVGLGFWQPYAESYVCGDANGDGTIDISDAVSLIAYIFLGGPAPNPLAAGDANCDGTVDISDAVYLISYIFSGGRLPCHGC